MTEQQAMKRELVGPGDALPEVIKGPITRSTLALFAGASSDYVPLHIDSDFARAAGHEDVFAHGMLSMAYLAQALVQWVSAENLLSWQVRFTAITPLNAIVHCRGHVETISAEDGKTIATLKIGTWTDSGLKTLDGSASVLID